MDKAQTILVLDTALGPCGAAIASEEGVIASKSVHQERAQAQILVPMVDEVLQEADKTYQDLTAIVTTVGPGSFTGLRISLSTARALGLALKVPVIGISTMDALAWQVLDQNPLEDNKTLCIVIETKRADFYAAYYDAALKQLYDPVSKSALDIISQHNDKIDILAGNATARFVENLGPTEMQRIEGVVRADTLEPATLAALAFEPEFHRDASPVYLRGADVSKPKHKQRSISS